jgi:hypothetical protein
VQQPPSNSNQQQQQQVQQPLEQQQQQQQVQQVAPRTSSNSRPRRPTRSPMQRSGSGDLVDIAMDATGERLGDQCLRQSLHRTVDGGRNWERRELPELAATSSAWSRLRPRTVPP